MNSLGGAPPVSNLSVKSQENKRSRCLQQSQLVHTVSFINITYYNKTQFNLFFQIAAIKKVHEIVITAFKTRGEVLIQNTEHHCILQNRQKVHEIVNEHQI